VPVIFFQHGGVATRFVCNPYQDFVEDSKLVEHNSVLSTKAEEMYLQERGGASAVAAVGTISTGVVISKSLQLRKKSKSAILYLTSPMASQTFRNLTTAAPDHHRLRTHQGIFEVVSEMGLDLDVKIHPTEQELYLRYFSQLSEKYQPNKISLIYGAPAEAILSAYNLVLLDFLPSTTAPAAMRLDIPIIYWFDQLDPVNPWFLSDLEERCYFVETKEHLRSRLNAYRNNELPSKHTIDFVKKYGEPTGREAGEKIAELLEQVV
jgi:hypothetical protein